MKLKKGDILRFMGDFRYSAKKGATSIYQGTTYIDQDGGELISVEWVRDGKDDGQKDGDYYLYMFEKVEDVSTQEEDRILDEIKKEKVMKFDLEKGKEGLVEYFQGDFDRATEYSLEYIKSCDDMDLVELEVKSFRAFKEEHNKMIGRIEYATTLSQIFSALDDTALEDDDETILSFFIKELQ
jgi:predicted SnoaL-like aldol condensation-catalyzing enzyme